MPQNELPFPNETPNETQAPGDAQISRRTEPTFDAFSLLQEGQSGERYASTREATGQAVAQGIIPDLQISDPVEEMQNETPANAAPAEPAAEGEAPATPTAAPEAPPAEPQAQQPARRGSIRAGLVSAAQAATSGVDGDIETADPLPDAPPRAIGEIASGFVDHIVEHPVATAGHVALGAAATVGVALLAPELAVGATIAGGAYLAYSAARIAGQALESARIFEHPAGHSPVEHARARTQLRTAGESLAEFATSAGGGAGTGRLAVSQLGRQVLGARLSHQLGHPGEGAVLGAEARRHAAAFAVERAPQATTAIRPTELVSNENDGRRHRGSGIRERLARIAQRAHGD